MRLTLVLLTHLATLTSIWGQDPPAAPKKAESSADASTDFDSTATLSFDLQPVPLYASTSSDASGPSQRMLFLGEWQLEAAKELGAVQLQLTLNRPELMGTIAPIDIAPLHAAEERRGEIWVQLTGDLWREVAPALSSQRAQSTSPEAIPLAELTCELRSPSREIPLRTQKVAVVATLSISHAQEQLQRWEARQRGHGKSPFEPLLAAALLALDLGETARADKLMSQAQIHLDVERRSENRSNATRMWLAWARLHRHYASMRSSHLQRCEDYLRDAERDAKGNPRDEAAAQLAWVELLLARAEATPSREVRFQALEEARRRAGESRQVLEQAGLLLPVGWRIAWARLSRLRGWKAEAQESATELLALPHLRARQHGAQLLATIARESEQLELCDRYCQQAIDALEARRAGLKDARGDGAFLMAQTAQLATTPYQDAVRAALDLGLPWSAYTRVELARARYGESPPTEADLKAFAQALPAAATLVTHFDSGDQICAFVVRQGKLTVERLGIDSKQLADVIRSLRDSHGTQANAAQWLYTQLIAPIRAQLKTRALYLAPFGLLRRVPFDTLFDGRDFMVEHYEIRQLPRSSRLKPAPERKGRARLLALLGPDTDYNGDGLQDQPTLPAADDGVAALAERLPGSLLLRGIAARESAFRTQVLKSRYVHLSCHGEYQPLSPWSSALLLSAGKGADGRLSAAELRQTPLTQVELITLSGCETGLAQVADTDDLAGFPRALLSAGAQRLLGTLWKVEDEFASAFMKRFYGELIAGRTIATALRNTRLQSLQIDGESSPAHWGAWALIEQHIWAETSKEVILEKRHEGESLPR